MRRAHILVAVWVLFVAFSTGCDIVREPKNIVVDLNDVFPDDLDIDHIANINMDGDKMNEWLVFYHLDLVQEGESPTAAILYRPLRFADKRIPPCLVPDLLWLPEQGYICLYKCKHELKDVITQDSPGEELVIYDKRDKDIVGAAIFRWNKDLEENKIIIEGAREHGGFVPLGHFRADAVKVEPDQVILTYRHNDRSNLATQVTYMPEHGQYYRGVVKTVYDTLDDLVDFRRAELVLFPAPPKDPVQVKQPEKLVMAFYHHFRDDPETLQAFFTESGWTNMQDGGMAEACGCESELKDVKRILVQRIAYGDQDSQETQVLIHIRCENKDEKLEKEAYFAWTVEQQPDSTWRLSTAAPTTQEDFENTSNQPTAMGGP